MALIQVNDLPIFSTVNRNDVYYWYQTTDLVFPFTLLDTPIDHGYWVVPYTGFSDPLYPITNSWINLTNNVSELPIEFLTKVPKVSSVLPIQYTSVSKEIGSNSTSYFINNTPLEVLSQPISYTVNNNIKEVISNTISYTTINTPIHTTSTSTSIDITPVIKDLVSDISLANNYTVTKDLINTATVSTNITKTKDLVETLPFVLDIASATPNLLVSSTVVLDFILKTANNIISNSIAIGITATPLYKASNPINVVLAAKDLVITDQVSININTVAPDYLDQNAPLINIDIVPHLEDYTSTVATNIDISITDAVVSTGIIDVLISGSNQYVSSNTTIIGIIPALQDYVSSVTYPVVYNLAKPNYIGPTDLLAIDINNRVKKWVNSNTVLVDVFAVNPASIVDEQEWVILKHIGMDGWDFMPFLDERTQSIIVDADTRKSYQGVRSAAQYTQTTLTPEGTVERMIVYQDETLAIKMSEIFIEYTSGFPYKMTTKHFDCVGNHYFTQTQFFVQGPNGEVTADHLTTNILYDPCSTSLYTTNSSVSILDAVYFDNSGILQKTLASNIATSNVIGFIATKQTSTNALVRSSGALAGFTGLTPGATYFLSTTTPGGITTTIPLVPNSVLKKVGWASSTTDLYIDVSERLAIRA